LATPEISDPIAAWSARPVGRDPGVSANAMTVDVEDYFQVEAFSRHIDRKEWDHRECRIERNTDRILEMFGKAGVHGTFFMLGWAAERFPSLVRRIVAGGHELASHGLSHVRADQQSRREFAADVSRARAILEDTGGVAVKGYRAASFSITRSNLWFFDALQEAGYRYSSSVYPIQHDLYGIPEAPRFAFYPLESREFVEIPVTSVRRMGANWPCGGGGYFRLLPYWFSAMNMRAVMRREKQPCVFYFHPWEIDAGQPRISGTPLKTRIRHYTNLGKTEGRLRRLLNDFRWTRLDRLYPVDAPSGARG
jgi:polysaccharide deacetylase family protein (PEP-CTERM system associated)